MSPGEARRLVEQLVLDPSSHVCAATQGYDFPISRESLLVADLWDLTWQSFPRRGRYTPHPGRPRRTQAVDVEKQRRVRQMLRRMGHDKLMDEIEGAVSDD